jgi:hypothetical protein
MYNLRIMVLSALHATLLAFLVIAKPAHSEESTACHR